MPALLAAALLAGTLLAAAPPNPAFAPVTGDPALPRVLLIGDSISIGYTVPVREMLAGEANVHRIPVNGGPTTRGLDRLDEWLGDQPWDVIHVNWGLHDLKSIDSKGRLTAVENGTCQVPPDEYRRNLATLFDRLAKTEAALIWATTTPVPPGSHGRIAGDAAKYNAVAAEVLKGRDVTTDDLHTFAAPRLKEIQRPANVHFTADGSRALGERVAESIRGRLAAE